MYKGKIDCFDCGKISSFEFEGMDVSDVTCPFCGSHNIFFQDLDFGKDTSIGGVKTGRGGCGGYRR